MNNQDVQIRSALDEYVASLKLPQYAVPFTASPDFPVIQYSKGVNVVSGIRPTKYTGFHIATEQSAELDNHFAGMGVPVVRVRHHNQTEDNYWQLDTIDGYILCKSVPAKYGPDSWQTGAVYVWNDHKDKYTYGSQLQVLFFLKGLLDLDYTQPLVLSFSRTVTEHFVQRVLRRQEAFLEAVKRAFRQSGKVVCLSSYAYWMTLAKDPEEIYPKGGGSYHPPMMAIDPPLTVQYLQEHQADPAHLEIIESFIPLWDTWALCASQRLMEPPKESNGDTQPSEPGEDASTSETAQSTQRAKEAKSSEDVSVISEQQMSSIRKLCEHLGKALPEDLDRLSFLGARALIQKLNTEYKESRKQPKSISPLQELYNRAKSMEQFEIGELAVDNVAAFLRWCSEVLACAITAQQDMTPAYIQQCMQYLDLVA